MKIALDAMGGDFAPLETVKGAIQALNEYETLEIALVGAADQLEKQIAEQRENFSQEEASTWLSRLEIVPASQVIEMDEEPAMALRKKKDSSIAVATTLVKKGEADALVSAGSTGAQMAAGLFILGRLKGVERPAIATVLPGQSRPKVLLDCGANVDCRANHLVQFAHMGSVYATTIFGISKPKVALLNIGEEASKGNELARQTYALLQDTELDFQGNVEGREVLSGAADIIVCDGFVGNIVLKLTEGFAQTVFSLIKEELGKDTLSKSEEGRIASALKNLQKRLDYSEYGGAPLLGVNGISIISHGSSKAHAIKNAIRVAKESVENNLVQQISQSLSELTINNTP